MKDFSKEELTRIWISLVQYRKYLDFINSPSTGTKVRYTLLAQKVDQMMYAKED